MNMREVALFPGRFQPFGFHHKKVYDKLVEMHGDGNVYIATSDIVRPPRSPFSFDEKKKILDAYGIKNVVQTRLPYGAHNNELVNHPDFNPDEDIIIYYVGKKDIDRFDLTSELNKDGTPKKVIGYDANKDNLKPFGEGVAYVRFVNVDIPADTLSGTIIRKYLSDPTKTKEDKWEFFKKATKLSDKKIFEFIVDKLAPKEQEMLSEGGAYGRLNHPFDDKHLTFGDMKEIIDRALSGKLNIESDVYEKLDGLNLMVTWLEDDGIRFARNKGQLKNWGENAMTATETAIKFADRGNLTKSFNETIKALQTAIGQMNSEERYSIFKDGKKFMSLEIILPTSKVTIPYGGASRLVFHGAFEYDKDGKIIDSDPTADRRLDKHLKDKDLNIQGNIEISGQQAVELKELVNADKKKQEFYKYVNALQNEFNLSDDDEVMRFHELWWERQLRNELSDFDVSDEVIDGLVRRYAHGDKGSFVLRKSNISNPQLLAKIKKFDDIDLKKVMKVNIKPFELIFLSLGAEVISNAAAMLSLNPDERTRELVDDLHSAIAEIKASDNELALSKLDDYLSIIEEIGGMDKVMPMEGLVFTYKGKNYKLTGMFAPVHQIISMFKFEGRVPTKSA